jgi:hypothetical protein
LQSLKAFESIHSLAKDLNELVIYPNKRVRALSRETLKSSAAIAVAQAFRSEDGIYASTVKIPDASRNLKRWTLALLKQITEAKKELSQLAFWSKFLSLPHPQFTLTGLSDKYQELYERLRELNSHCTVRQLPEAAKQIVGQIEDLLNSITLTGSVNSQERNNVISLLESLRLAAINAASIAVSEIEQISLISEHCRQFCQMDFRFLYNPRRQLLSVGFNASKRQLEGSCYDLMASESRLTSFLAVSHGQLPVDHWFALGRMVNLSSGKPVLLSWSGSMFEYLMPSLFMPSHSGSIAETSCRIALQHQIQFARHHGVPWGISESCYHETDLNQLYQYRAFGVPELSLRQKPDDRLVITPYASALAIRVAPHEACSNLMRLEKLGCLGPMGFYDALDYTKNKSYPNKESPSLCRIVMAHHNGMILLAFANELLGDVMIRRFLCNPFCEAHDLLLQERIPQNIKPHRMNA